MARQWLIPGYGFIAEDGEKEYLLPGYGFFDEKQPAAAPAVGSTLVRIERHYPRGASRGIMRGVA